MERWRAGPAGLWSWMGALGLGAALTSGCDVNSGGGSGEGGSGSAATGVTGGGAGGSASSSRGATGGSGGATSSSGTGGMGGVCVPLSTAPCYDGPPGTLGVGVCTGGTKTCAADGASYGPCVGQVTPSAEVCASAADESCDGSPGCSGGCIWSKRFGDAMDQIGGTVVADSAGNVVILGAVFSGSIDFGGGPLVADAGANNTFVAKLDGSGNHLFSKLLRCSEFGGYQGVAVDEAGNILLSGICQGTLSLGVVVLTTSASSQGFVLKLDPAGALIWDRYMPGTNNNRVKADAQGNVIIAGNFMNLLDLGGGPLVSAGGVDIYVAKLDAAGAFVWSRSFGSSKGDSLQDITVGLADRVIVATGR